MLLVGGRFSDVFDDVISFDLVEESLYRGSSASDCLLRLSVGGIPPVPPEELGDTDLLGTDDSHNIFKGGGRGDIVPIIEGVKGFRYVQELADF